VIGSQFISTSLPGAAWVLVVASGAVLTAMTFSLLTSRIPSTTPPDQRR
jgi:hypothetical protein